MKSTFCFLLIFLFTLDATAASICSRLLLAASHFNAQTADEWTPVRQEEESHCKSFSGHYGAFCSFYSGINGEFLISTNKKIFEPNSIIRLNPIEAGKSTIGAKPLWETQSIPGGYLKAVSFSPDGKQVALKYTKALPANRVQYGIRDFVLVRTDVPEYKEPDLHFERAPQEAYNFEIFQTLNTETGVAESDLDEIVSEGVISKSFGKNKDQAVIVALTKEKRIVAWNAPDANHPYSLKFLWKTSEVLEGVEGISFAYFQDRAFVVIKLKAEQNRSVYAVFDSVTGTQIEIHEAQSVLKASPLFLSSGNG